MDLDNRRRVSFKSALCWPRRDFAASLKLRAAETLEAFLAASDCGNLDACRGLVNIGG